MATLITVRTPEGDEYPLAFDGAVFVDPHDADIDTEIDTIVALGFAGPCGRPCAPDDDEPVGHSWDHRGCHARQTSPSNRLGRMSSAASS